MKISEFIANLLPKSTLTRDLAIKKLDEQKIVSGIFFLIEAAKEGDVTALMAISTLLLKESNNCQRTKEVIKGYMQKVLKSDKNNKLARKILTALKDTPTNVTNTQAKSPSPRKPNKTADNIVQTKPNVIALGAKEPVNKSNIYQHYPKI